MDCALMSAPLHSISAAESPTRSGHRIIGRPCDGSIVNAVGRAAAARIADAASPEEIVPALSVERLIVAIIRRMILALDALAVHLATISGDLPSARGGSWWLRSRGRSWSGIGEHWLNASLLHNPVDVVGDSRPHAWIARVGTAISPRCSALDEPKSSILANQRAAAVALASIGCAPVVVAIGTDHIVGDSSRIVAVALLVRFDVHHGLLEDARPTASRGKCAPASNPAICPCRHSGLRKTCSADTWTKIEGRIDPQQHEII